MTNVELLRKAVATLRERAAAATSGPWVEHDCSDGTYNSDDGDGWWWVWRESALPSYGGVAETESHPPDCVVTSCNITDGTKGAKERSDAAYIATMHPGVGLALADWLGKEADFADYGDEWCSPHALVIARLISQG